MKKKSVSLLLFMSLFLLGPLSAQHKEILDSLNFSLETAKNDSARISVLANISAIYLSFDLSMSFQYAEKALEVAENSKSQMLISQAHMNIGNAYFFQGLFDMSAKHFYAAMEIYRDMGHELGLANSLANLGGLHLQLIEFDEAITYLDEALEIYLNIADEKGDTLPPKQVISSYNNLGIAYENLEDYNTALEYYLRGISLAKRMPSEQRFLAMLHNNIGSCYMKRGNPDDALENMEEALRIRIANADKAGEASSYRMIGLFYSSEEMYSEALSYFNRGYSLANETGSKPVLAGISEQIFEIYNMRNQSDSALKYHVLWKNYSDQLKQDESLRELTRLKIESQFQEREKMQEVEQKRQLLRLTVFLVVSFFFLIILALLYSLARSRIGKLSLRNKNMQLTSEKSELERKALSRELEIKNKELTTNVMYQIRKNELINRIIEKLIGSSHTFKKENQTLVNEIIKELENTQEDNIWKEFEVRFHQVHNLFYERLNEINPELSTNERRLCAFLRLNMTTKEISSMTGQSLRSIDVARTRLRKKLNLTNSELGLIEFLSGI